jgi:hypothetical protein
MAVGGEWGKRGKKRVSGGEKGVDLVFFLVSGCLFVCLFVWLFGCLFGCLVVWLFGCLVVWLFVCLVGCLCVVHLFQVPEKTNVPNSWSFNSKKKGYKRYYTPETLGWKEQLELIDEEIQECTSNRLRTLFRTFSRSHVALKMACKCIARLDALMSLACASEHIQNGENEDAWHRRPLD